MKKWRNKVKAVVVNAISIMYMVMIYCTNVYASIQNSIYVTGTKKLFGDLLTAVQIVAIPIVVALVAFWALKRKASDDQAEDTQLKKKQVGSLITLIVIETAAPFIKLILGYYNISM